MFQVDEKLMREWLPILAMALGIGGDLSDLGLIVDRAFLNSNGADGAFNRETFAITLLDNYKDLNYFLFVFAHELVHYKQVKEGRLVWNETDGKLYWLGEDAQDKYYYYRYCELPWEIEADREAKKAVRVFIDVTISSEVA